MNSDSSYLAGGTSEGVSGSDVPALPAMTAALLDAIESAGWALDGLLDDTQHKEHDCGEVGCPVTEARRSLVALRVALDAAAPQQPARLLTSAEFHAELPVPRVHGEYIGSQTVAFTWFAWSAYIDAIQRKFCEVNGISLATGAPHAE